MNKSDRHNLARILKEFFYRRKLAVSYVKCLEIVDIATKALQTKAHEHGGVWRGDQEDIKSLKILIITRLEKIFDR